MAERILILDPGFISGEGHHLGVSGMLGAAAIELGHEPTLVANARSPLSTISYETFEVPVAALLPQSPYPGSGTRTLDELLAFNERAYQQLVDLPDYLFEKPVRVLVHTTNEIQVLGLAQWLSEQIGNGERVKSAVVALMMPPPIIRKADGIAEEDAAICEIYRRALRILSATKNVEILGIGATIAEDHAQSAAIKVGIGGALIGGINRTLGEKSESELPRILLYMGDAKLDKGLHMLPDIITRLRKRGAAAKFVIHLSGSMVERYGWIIERIKNAAKDDDRFEIMEGRLGEQTYYDLWDTSDAVVLCYHPGVYARKTSGICWDAMNRGIPAVAIADTWHMLELSRYHYPVVPSPAFLAVPLVNAILSMIGQLPALSQAAIEGRERFRTANDPKLYITKLLDKVAAE
ncbi:MAG TPA: hypothetical protein VK779_01710 [Rhizomicrobium sp.]|jgi:hypothetical protein|nr:hypothetical protein [Rhizomicrobium sp.]